MLSRKYERILVLAGGFISVVFFLHAISVSHPVGTDWGGGTISTNDGPMNDRWTKIDLYNLTEAEKREFFRYKDGIYHERRERIAKYCSIITSVFESGPKNRMLAIRKESLVYNFKDKVAYCQIAKVASSTWCRHFVELAQPDEQEYRKWRNALQLYAPFLWPLPPRADPAIAMGSKDITSLVVVRHPFSRVSSVYFQKVIELSEEGGWGPLSEYIIDLCRKHPRRVNPKKRVYMYPEDNPKFPTPEEYVCFLNQDLRNSEVSADQHWRPQHGECPFCLFNFTIYSKMEEMDEDTAYFLMKAKLTDKLNAKLNFNPSQRGGVGSDKERRFWAKVSRKAIVNLYEPYRLDFMMFDYSLETYLRNLGLEEKIVMRV